MGIGYYVVAARQHWLALTTFLLLGVLTASLLAFAATPMYSTTAEVYVITDTGDSANDLVQSSDFSQKQVRSFSALATRPVVLDPVISELGLETTAGALSDQVSANSILNTNLISITASSESPSEAALLANSVAGSLKSVVSGIVPKLANGNSTVDLKVVRQASIPASPSSPRVPIWLFLGAVIGLALGASFVAVRQLLDNKVTLPAQAEEISGAPVLGAILDDSEAAVRPILDPTNPAGPRAEAFRQVRTNLEFLGVPESQRLVVITSSIPGEGKTTTAINLAISLAGAGKSVCIVDADLRRPSIAKYLDLADGVGLSNLLVDGISLGAADVVQPWGPLSVITSGPTPPNPAELLASRQCTVVLEALTSRFDHVIVDSPPLVPVVDALVLGHVRGGVLLVIGSGTVERKDLQQAVMSLSVAHVPIRGVILTRVKPQSVSRYAYTYEHDSTRSSVKHGRRRTETREPPPVAERETTG